MKIAYYNPYLNSAENQIYASMELAGSRLGLELLECKDDVDICAFDPDFVISVTAQVPKVTHHPSYLAMHEPNASIFSHDVKFPNILSYDGYLTISDSIVRFIQDFTYGVHRDEEPGFFYLTPQKAEISVDWSKVVALGNLKIAYFGTNWKSRMPKLLGQLDSMNLLRIHGPKAAWDHKGYASYRGPVDFDGMGPQRVYAECGAGLVLLDQKWQDEDVISNRIFEISSVGAVAFCPDIPWIRKWFGDSVQYFDTTVSYADMAKQIQVGYEACISDPQGAMEMATKARSIFEEKFSAERMLENAVAYHERKLRNSAARIAMAGPEAEISVIVRCGGRSAAQVKIAVDSLIRQTFGKIHIIFAKYRDIDLSELKDDIAAGGLSFEQFLTPQGSRAQMLYEALRRVKTEYFSVLDDDDQLMPEHFEALFIAGRRMSPHFDVAFSGTMDAGRPVDLGAHTPCNRVISRFGFTRPVRRAWDLYVPIHIGSMVARADLLAPDLLRVPDIKTAEDSLLLSIVTRRSKPIFSYRASFLYTVDSDNGSNWSTDPDRRIDETSLAIRTGLCLTPSWIVDEPSISRSIMEYSRTDKINPIFVDKTYPASERSKLHQILRRPSILLGPIAPRWRAYKARWRARSR